jgi:hypothetical protein
LRNAENPENTEMQIIMRPVPATSTDAPGEDREFSFAAIIPLRGVIGYNVICDKPLL